MVREVPLSDFVINPENFRFNPVSSQRDAIDVMIRDQGDGLVLLAQSIAEDGLNPNDKISVAFTGPEQDIITVLEGNRRILALKLLDNPNLIENDPRLKKRFEALNSEYKGKIPQQLEVNFFDDPSEAYKWISLKHTGANEGVGTVVWDGMQTARYRAKMENKSSTSLQIQYFANFPP